MLRDKLNKNLISKRRELVIEGIEKDFKKCKARILELCSATISNQQNIITLAEKSSEEMRAQLNEATAKKKSVEAANQEIKEAAKQLEKKIANVVNILGRSVR